MLDSDELDRIHPAPPDLWRVTEQSLSAVWAVLERFGAFRLILVGVYVDLDSERDWIARAVPRANVTCVRLIAAPSHLAERNRRREIGSGADDQLERTMRQVAKLDKSPVDPKVRVIATDGRSPVEVAADVAAFWPRGQLRAT